MSRCLHHWRPTGQQQQPSSSSTRHCHQTATYWVSGWHMGALWLQFEGPGSDRGMGMRVHSVGYLWDQPRKS